MKKVLALLLSLFMVMGLFGCGVSVNKDFNINEYSETLNSSDRIDVMKDGNRVDMISGHQNLEEFIGSLNLDKWKISELPEYKEINLEFLMFTREAKKAKQKDDDVKFKQVASIVSYKEIPYVTLKIATLEFDFKVPDDVIDYLNTF